MCLGVKKKPNQTKKAIKIEGSSDKEEKRPGKSEIVTRCPDFLGKNDNVQLQG